MPKYVSAEQLKAALQELANFRQQATAQKLQHVLPFLALRRKEVNAERYTVYQESDDFEFFNEFFRVRGGDRPYFDPIASQFRIASHPHSNVATARKQTFASSWKAAEFREGEEGEEWQLAHDYVATFKKRVLTKGRKTFQIPGSPLAVFMYRKTAMAEEPLTVKQLVALLLDDCHLTAEEGELIRADHELDKLPFADEPLSDPAIEAVIRASGVLPGRTTVSDPTVDEADPIVRCAWTLLFDDGFGGVALVGAPGTSKSWYAMQIALLIADGEKERIANIQFHKSYQYEQFVESYVPRDDGTGFTLAPQALLKLCEKALADPEHRFVLLIDELSRSDPGRVFGEALTYMESSRRGESFLLASGKQAQIPLNVVFIATMNDRDKSISEIDDAFDRRMAKIQLSPSPELLELFLSENGMDDALRRRVAGFFKWANEQHPDCPLGHTFFLRVRDRDSLRRLWDNQLQFLFKKAFRFEPDVFREIQQKYEEVVLSESPP